ncbi:PspA/IM30 family protein, partial [Methylobacterium fujisawaense]
SMRSAGVFTPPLIHISRPTSTEKSDIVPTPASACRPNRPEQLLDEGREDLAEAALSRQIDFETQARALDDVQAQVRVEEAELEAGLAALVARKGQMEEALAAFEVSKGEAGNGSGSMRREHTPGQRLDVAEKAFERAMKGVGGVGFTPAEAGTIHRVAEIDALQKSAAVAQRLAALKAGRAA